MKIGFHTDAFNSAYFSFEKCLQWAKTNDVHYIECGLIDGVSPSTWPACSISSRARTCG